MHDTSPPFTFNYFGNEITAQPLGISTIPDLSQVTSVHVMPMDTDGNIIAVNVIDRGIDIPGGHVDAGETSPLTTLSRELAEEAHISVKTLY